MPKSSSPEKKRVQQLNLLEPDKNISRRQLQRFDKNPFVDTALLNQLSGTKNVFYTQSTQHTLIDLETSEITPARTQIVKTIRADKEQFVKIYTTHLKAFFELNQTAYKILQYVLYTVQNDAINTDKVYLNLIPAQQYFSAIDQTCSPASYYRGMKDLVVKLFIAETTSQNLYYINPKLFFNGDRVQFITTFEMDNDEKKHTLQSYQNEMQQIKDGLLPDNKD
jgi:hypothetical protein